MRVLVGVVTGLVAVLGFAPASAGAPADRVGELTVVAGTGQVGYSGDGWDARKARLSDRLGVSVGSDGTVYVTDTGNGRVRRVGADGVIDTVAGTRALRAPETDGPTVDGLTYSPSNTPYATAVAADGAVYVAAARDIRRIAPDGTSTVVGGNGDLSYDGDTGGDGGPATAAWIYRPADIALDAGGNLFVADGNNARIRRIDGAGTITTVAGGGDTPPDAAAGQPATAARLARPTRVAVDNRGAVYFAVEADGRTLYRVDPDGTLRTMADLDLTTGIVGLTVQHDGTLVVAEASGRLVRVTADGAVHDDLPRSTMLLDDVAAGPDGDLYLACGGRVLRMSSRGKEAAKPAPVAPARWTDEDAGTVHTIAGTGKEGAADRPTGTTPGPSQVAVGPDGELYLAAPTRNQVLRVSRKGAVSVFAGSGKAGAGGNGKPAEKAELSAPSGVAVGADGSVYVADTGNDVVRRIDEDGIIGTYAQAAAVARLAVGGGGGVVVVDAADVLYATAPDTQQFLRIDAAGAATTFAGGGTRWAEDADGAPATEAALRGAVAVAVDAGGVGGAGDTVYFAEGGYPAVRAVLPNGVLAPFAGSAYRDNDESGFGGDGGPAPAAELNSPGAVAAGADGVRYIADTGNNRVRRVGADGVITTIAGTGEPADRGDGGPAVRAAVFEPDGIAVGADGSVYVTSSATTRVRVIRPDGTIATFAELPTDRAGGPADRVALRSPSSVAVAPDGAVYVADQTTGTRVVAPDGTIRSLGADLFGQQLTASSVATGPDGSVYLARGAQVLRRYPDGAVLTVLDGTREAPVAEPLTIVDVAVGPHGEVFVAAGPSVYRVRGTTSAPEKVWTIEGEDAVNGIAVGADGTVYATGRYRVYAITGRTARPVAGTGDDDDEDDGDGLGDGGPATEAALREAADVAVAADGTVYVSTLDGIRRVDTDGDIETVFVSERKVDGSVTTYTPPDGLAVDAGGNLYFAEPFRHQVRVLVRANEVTGPFQFPWLVVWLGLPVLAAVAAIVVVRRRKAAAAPATATGDDTDPET